VACKLCGIMNGEEYDQEDEYILFSLAELLNILSGNAISMLNNKHKGLSLRICPPSVFVGQRLNINSPKVKVKIVKVHTDAGDIYLSVGFEGGR
jgi:chemotaxis protein CheX